MDKLSIFTERVRNGYILVGSAVGLIVAGLAPAILFGYSLYHALVVQGWLSFWAGVAGFSLAVTMEVVGGVSAHVAQHARNFNIKVTAYFTLAIYTLTGLGYMMFFEPNDTIQRTGVMAYLVAPLLYLAVALLSATLQQGREREEGKQQAMGVRRDDLEWTRRQQEIKDAREHEVRIKQAELDAGVRMVEANRASTEPAPMLIQPAPIGYLCEDCQRSFATVQALNAHGRFCGARHPARANGKVNGFVHP